MVFFNFEVSDYPNGAGRPSLYSCFIFEISDYTDGIEKPFLYSFSNLKMIWKTDSIEIIDAQDINCY